MAPQYGLRDEEREAAAERAAAADDDRHARILRSAVAIEVSRYANDLRALQDGHVTLTLELQGNTAATARVEKIATDTKESVAEIVQILAALKGFATVCGWITGWIGKLTPPAAVVAGVAAAGIAGWHWVQPHLPHWLGGPRP